MTVDVFKPYIVNVDMPSFTSKGFLVLFKGTLEISTGVMTLKRVQKGRCHFARGEPEETAAQAFPATLPVPQTERQFPLSNRLQSPQIQLQKGNVRMLLLRGNELLCTLQKRRKERLQMDIKH